MADVTHKNKSNPNKGNTKNKIKKSTDRLAKITRKIRKNMHTDDLTNKNTEYLTDI